MGNYLINGRPTVTLMLKEKTPDALINEINEGLKIGTDCFGFQIDLLQPEYRNAEVYKRILSAMKGKPSYVTNYLVGAPDKTDEELAEGLITAFKCGGTLLDVRGGMFASDNHEFSEDAEAVKKQKEFISAAHDMGAEILMSTHIFDRFVPRDEVLKIMLAQQERGADIAKLVTTANSPEELDENFEITLLLKKELNIPFLFLCNGSHARSHRMLNPILGSCTYLAKLLPSAESQPVIEDVKAIMELNQFENLPW